MWISSYFQHLFWKNHIQNTTQKTKENIEFKGQSTNMSSKYWVGVLDDSGGFWLGFWFLTMMGMGNNVPNNLC